MKKRVFVLMATYNHNESSGGSIARKTVEMLCKKVSEVIVITVGEFDIYKKDNLKILTIPSGCSYKISLMLTRIGWMEDYLEKWVGIVMDYFSNTSEDVPKKNDTVIATTVGELGTLKLGLYMKRKYNTKYIIHFHDPVKHALVNGKKYGKYSLPYASREKFEKTYVLNADKIITCSKTFEKYLCMKYPQIINKCENYYFGWISAPERIKQIKKKNSNLVIAYGGNFGWPQGPEILAKAAKKIEGVKIVYIGSWRNYKPVNNLNDKNIEKIPRLGHQEYLNYLIDEVDIGFLSLSRDYFSACVPAKLYEYINVCKPMLAALPESDGKDIINKNHYGIAVDYNMDSLCRAIKQLKSVDLKKYKDNLIRDRSNWQFENQMTGFVESILES